MQVSSVLIEAADILESLLFEGMPVAAPVLRSQAGPASSRLLDAGVVFLGAAEIWYELVALAPVHDLNQVPLLFRIVSESPLAGAITVAIRFGDHEQLLRVDSQDSAVQLVPLLTMQDPHTKRIRTPVVLVFGENEGGDR